MLNVEECEDDDIQYVISSLRSFTDQMNKIDLKSIPTSLCSEYTTMSTITHHVLSDVCASYLRFKDSCNIVELAALTFITLMLSYTVIPGVDVFVTADIGLAVKKCELYANRLEPQQSPYYVFEKTIAFKTGNRVMVS